MNWEKFDEVRDCRRSILLDTLYDSIIFAVGKGFPWVEVVKVVKFTEELLKETKGMVPPGQESERLAGGGETHRTPCSPPPPRSSLKSREPLSTSPTLFLPAFTLPTYTSMESLSRLLESKANRMFSLRLH